MRYIMYFRFCRWRHMFSYNTENRPESKTTRTFCPFLQVAVPGQSMPALTLGSMHAEVLPWTMCLPTLELLAQAVFPLERAQTNRRDWTLYSTPAWVITAWKTTGKTSEEWNIVSLYLNTTAVRWHGLGNLQYRRWTSTSRRRRTCLRQLDGLPWPRPLTFELQNLIRSSVGASEYCA